jgi:hypothetical protein
VIYWFFKVCCFQTGLNLLYRYTWVFSMSEEDDDDHIVEQMAWIQRAVGGTPRQYVTFVDQYRHIFKVKREVGGCTS